MDHRLWTIAFPQNSQVEINGKDQPIVKISLNNPYYVCEDFFDQICYENGAPTYNGEGVSMELVTDRTMEEKNGISSQRHILWSLFLFTLFETI